MINVFVYGTLKSGKSRNFYLTQMNGKLLSSVKTAPKYRLLKQWFGDYPCMIEDLDKGYSVEGELWSVPEKGLESLDSIEGVSNSIFVRSTIKMQDGSEAQGYLAKEKPFPYSDIGSTW